MLLNMASAMGRLVPPPPPPPFPSNFLSVFKSPCAGFGGKGVDPSGWLQPARVAAAGCASGAGTRVLLPCDGSAPVGTTANPL